MQVIKYHHPALGRAVVSHLWSFLPCFCHAVLQEACTRPGTGMNKPVSAEPGKLRAPLPRQWPTISEAAKQLRLHWALLPEILQILT